MERHWECKRASESLRELRELKSEKGLSWEVLLLGSQAST